MSSKILVGDSAHGAIQPIVWRRSGPPQPTHPPAAFEPAVSIDPETAVLRNRLLDAENCARQAVDAARRQGLAEGEAKGRAQAAEQLEPVLAQLAKTIEDLAALRPRLRDEAESDVVKLSLAIARRILHREISVDPGALQALVQVALERLTRQEIYRIRVNPAQAPAIRAALARSHREFELHEDPRLENGALIFETNRGRMDASVTAQLEEIERGLTDRVQQR